VIRVFLVATSPLARAGLRNLLTNAGFAVVGAAATVESLAEEWIEAEFDLVLIEVSGEEHESLLDTLVKTDTLRDAATVILVDQSPPGWLNEALHAGVRAILPREITPDQLKSALEAVSTGLVVIHPLETNALLPAAAVTNPRGIADLAEPLTRREREVLQMLAAGLGNKEIATRLIISDHTVKFHVASILGKLGASTRTEAVAIGIRRGLVLL